SCCHLVLALYPYLCIVCFELLPVSVKGDWGTDLRHYRLGPLSSQAGGGCRPRRGGRGKARGPYPLSLGAVGGHTFLYWVSVLYFSVDEKDGQSIIRSVSPRQSPGNGDRI